MEPENTHSPNMYIFTYSAILSYVADAATVNTRFVLPWAMQTAAHLAPLLVLAPRLRQLLLQLQQHLLQGVHLVHEVGLLVVQLSVGHHGPLIFLLDFRQRVLRKPGHGFESVVRKQKQTLARYSWKQNSQAWI